LPQSNTFYLNFSSIFPLTFSNNFKNKVVIKLVFGNIIVQILLIKYLLLHTKVGYAHFFYKKYSKRTFITTKAPYKNKITRNQYLLKRHGYGLVVLYNTNYNKLVLTNLKLKMIKQIISLVSSLDFNPLLINYIKLNINIFNIRNVQN
jgi:hypothetical protein